MAPPATRIDDIAHDLLDAVVTNHGGVLPGRQYVSAGAPAWDCELVAVWWEATFNVEGSPDLPVSFSQPAGAGHTMRAGTFVVTIVRCTPAVPESRGTTVKNTTVAQEQEASLLLDTDAQRLVNAVLTAEKAGDLPGCHGLVFGEESVVGPEGGFVAVELRVSVGLSHG